MKDLESLEKALLDNQQLVDRLANRTETADDRTRISSWINANIESLQRQIKREKNRLAKNERIFASWGNHKIEKV